MKVLEIKTCKDCGSTNIKREGVDCGYSSARPLGRPAGAKGRDEYTIVESCQDCGSLRWEERPAPCHICGEEGVIGVSTLHIGNEIWSGCDCVYGIPDHINLCGAEKCKKALHTEIERLIDQAFEGGGYDE